MTDQLGCFWAARPILGRILRSMRFSLFSYFSEYTYMYTLYILDLFLKIMGIQLNTLEFNGARPCSCLITRLIQKFMQNIIFLLWLALLIEVFQELLKFNDICVIFFE